MENNGPRRNGMPDRLQDIINRLKKSVAKELPKFRAQKVQPNSLEEVELNNLLNDIVSIKATLTDMQLRFEASQDNMSDIRMEINEMHESIDVSSAELGARRGRITPGVFPGAATAPWPQAPALPISNNQPTGAGFHPSFATADERPMHIQPLSDPLSIHDSDEEAIVDVPNKRARLQ